MKSASTGDLLCWGSDPHSGDPLAGLGRERTLFPAALRGPCSESPRKTGQVTALEVTASVVGEGKEFSARVSQRSRSWLLGNVPSLVKLRRRRRAPHSSAVRLKFSVPQSPPLNNRNDNNRSLVAVKVKQCHQGEAFSMYQWH